MKKYVMAVAILVMLGMLSACGNQKELYGEQTVHSTETSETMAILTDPPTETTQRAKPMSEQRIVALGAMSTTTSTTASTMLSTSTSTTTTTTTATTEAVTEPTEPFALSSEVVADKMHEYFSAKGYSNAQIAGIVGNAEIESGLEPSRGIPGGGFGLFQLMDCSQRREMMAEFDAKGVGKYATSDYWAFGASDFDTAEDFDTFMTVMLDYTMDEDDPTWMSEIQTTDSPETAAEIFLVHYERAIDGDGSIEYYEPYLGRYYQATDSRREAARRWYEYFAS